MKGTVTFIVVLGMLTSIKAVAQENESNFGIKFSGYVKSDFFFDSRQAVTAREGHFYLWPSAESSDVSGEDINAKPNLNFLAVQSRLTGTITGPDAFGARISGVIEGDFFGQQNININLFRLRQAFVRIRWTNTEVVAGQYWNPLFVTGCFPAVISFNTGVPIMSFAQNPQIRLTQNFGNLQVVIAALAQRDYTSRGPDPADNSKTLVSSDFLRNSSLPDMHLQLHYSHKNEANGSSILIGAGYAIKTIVPRLYAEVGGEKHKVDEKLRSQTAIAFANFTFKPVTIKVQGRYGENIADVLAISGFAVKDIEDPVTGESSYTPLKSMSFWGELQTNGSSVQTGIFCGYLKNKGTKEEMSDVDNHVYGLGTNIESLFRISPRVVFISNKLKIALEMEYTSAAYGSDYDTNYLPAITSTVSNTRILLSTIYSF